MTLSNAPQHLCRRVWAGVIGLLLILFAGCGGGPNPVTVPTPTIPAIQFTTLNLNLPAAALNAPVIGMVPDDTILHVSITFKINQQILDQLNSAKVPQGQTLNVQDLAKKLGISDQTYQQIKAFFGVQNATVKLNQFHTNLTIDAKAKTFAAVLGTRFVIHKLNGRTFFTPAANAPPKLPTILANQILAVTGLDNYSMVPHFTAFFQHPHAAGLKKRSTADCNPAQNTLTTQQIAQQYGYDQFYNAGFHGEGMTVNLVEFDPLVQSDVQNYFACVHYQSSKLKVVDVGSAPTKVQGEATGDVELIAGLLPAAKIVDYETDLSGAQTNDDVWTLFNDELKQLINDNSKSTGTGNVVSISLGVTESLITKGNMDAIDQSFQILTKAEHMTVFVASSDCGAYDIASEGGNYSHLSESDLSVSFPASDPWVVAVGGTSPALDNQNSLFEQVWSDRSNLKVCNNIWGSGGGLSTVYSRPSWQTGQVVQNKFANGMRQMPDIAAFASDIALYFQGQWEIGGGTSFATPIWAAGMILVNQDLFRQVRGFYAGPAIFYQAAQVGPSMNQHPYFDVTQGDNLYYHATPGWDFATGFGTPNLQEFFKTLVAIANSPEKR